jgi:hypothetical protein
MTADRKIWKQKKEKILLFGEKRTILTLSHIPVIAGMKT